MRRRGFLRRVFAAGAGLPWIGTISSRGAATAAERVSKAAAGRWSIRWIDPLSGKIQSAEPVDGGVRARLRLPRKGPAALLLSR